MKKKIVSLALVLAIIAPVTANAGFLRSLVDSFGFQLSLTANETLDLFGALADDIGEMADRILIMSDKILEMADKIVATEEIMAGLVVDIAEIKTNTSSNDAPGMFISTIQTDLYNNECPTFTMSDSPAEYVVYVSSALTMNTNTISVLVHNQAELEALWPNLVTLGANGKVYIGVKSISANTISSLSNILEYNLF